jgi:hypothetical protein
MYDGGIKPRRVAGSALMLYLKQSESMLKSD